MIGMEVPHLVSSLIPDVGGAHKASPIARFTRLGWVVGGPTGTAGTTEERATFAFFAQNRWLPPEETQAERWDKYQFQMPAGQQPEDARDLNARKGGDAALNSLVARMWEVDAAVGKMATSPADEEIFEQLQQKLEFKEGKYQLPTLWKPGHPHMGNNYHYAKTRLRSLHQSKHMRDPFVRKEYEAQLTELEKRGYVEKVDTQCPETDAANYLPHFPVVRLDKSSTQVRLIMDAAAKVGKQLCLNDCLYKGPKFINELVSVLLRFRAHKITLAADVKKMFFQIRLDPKDRDYHRYLWGKEGDPIEVYRWKVHPFGSAASPCIAMFTIKEHAKRWRKQFPKAAETVIHSTLVDDNMDSVRTVQEGKELGRQLMQLYAKAGMRLGKVVSNSAEVLGTFPESMVAPSLEIAEICTQDLGLPLVKALGVIYLCKEDVFTYRMEPTSTDKVWTKREILRHEAKLYDPHGLIAPHTVKARIILQQIWRAKLGWDQQVPLEILAEWERWLEATKVLPRLRIPRCLQATEQNSAHTVEAHIFADASENAYAAAAYIVSYHKASTETRLALAKARVAPLHLTSIPRLELMAADMATELMTALKSALAMSPSQFTFWTDSMNVLCWLRAESRLLHTFVGTRIARIQQVTSVQQWRWVNTENNPADIPSRGVTAEKLVNNNLWFQGPAFLRQGKNHWPKEKELLPSKDTIQELKKESVFALLAEHELKDDYNREQDSLTDFQHVSNKWTKIIRLVAWCYRWKHRAKGPLTKEELDRAEGIVLKQMQEASFARTLAAMDNNKALTKVSAIQQLQPFRDIRGIIRAGSRLTQVKHIDYEAKHQVVLHKKHPLTRALIRHIHEHQLHAGPQHVWARLLQRFWILQGSNTVRMVTRTCIECKKRKARPTTQLMAPLPAYRFPEERADPFAATALDAAGPFLLKEKDGTKKIYLVLFTCMIYRAVHLEPLYAMSAASFLQALDRFTARRGVPDRIVSDNGTNFTAAAAEIRRLCREKQAVEEKKPEITWHFLPPYSPHFGGVHERMIQATKAALFHAFKPNQAVTIETFTTALTVVEGILNSRPLTYVSNNVDVPEPITPAHFLNVRPYRQTAELPDTRAKQSAWRKLQDRLDHFWRRFLDEMTPHLQIISKWRMKTRNFKEGDVVIFLEKKRRGVWPLGKVTKALPSDDGLVRKVHVQAKGNTYVRAVEKVMLLLPDQEDAEEKRERE